MDLFSFELAKYLAQNKKIVKEMTEKNGNGHEHIAFVIADRSFWLEYLCQDLTSQIKANGCKDQARKINFFPAEISKQLHRKESVFLVPVILVNDTKEIGKISIPIFMIVFTPSQREEIKRIGAKKKLKIFEKHFFKPTIVEVLFEYEDQEESAASC